MELKSETPKKTEKQALNIPVVARSSFFIKPKDWDLFQWCYAYVLWALFWCGLINLIVWVFS